MREGAECRVPHADREARARRGGRSTGAAVPARGARGAASGDVPVLPGGPPDRVAPDRRAGDLRRRKAGAGPGGAPGTAVMRPNDGIGAASPPPPDPPADRRRSCGSRSRHPLGQAPRPPPDLIEARPEALVVGRGPTDRGACQIPPLRRSRAARRPAAEATLHGPRLGIGGARARPLPAGPRAPGRRGAAPPPGRAGGPPASCRRKLSTAKRSSTEGWRGAARPAGGRRGPGGDRSTFRSGWRARSTSPRASGRSRSRC